MLLWVLPYASRVNVQKSSVKHLPSTARRIYRILAHAYFHHRDIFDTFEVRVFAVALHLIERRPRGFSVPASTPLPSSSISYRRIS